MKFIREVPKEPGWYWVRRRHLITGALGDPSVVRLRDDDRIMSAGSSQWMAAEYAAKNKALLWGDPIPAPETVEVVDA